MTHDFSRIPEELKALRQWVNWRQEIVNGRSTKVPYQPNGVLASSINPATWSSFEAVCAAVGNFSGIGFMFSKDDPYCGIDLDSIKEKDTPKRKVIAEKQKKLYDDCPSYTELSPSKEGAHIIVRASILHGIHPDGFGIFSQGRFFTFTGDVIRDLPIIDCQNVIDTFAPKEQATVAQSAPKELQHIYDSLSKIERAVELAMGRWQQFGYPSQSEADQAFMNFVALSTQNILQMKDVFKNTYLYRKDKGDNYIERTAKSALNRPQLPQIVHQLTPPLQETFIPPTDHLYDPLFDPPPGLLGEIAQYIYDQAPRPVREIALAGAIALMAGICGRPYNVSNSGLNHYIALVARSGRGKEAVKSGISKLMSAVQKTNMATVYSTFSGPSDFSSGPALIRYISETSQCFLTIMGEFGLRMQNLSAGKAAAHDRTLMSRIMDLYHKSGAGETFDPSVYADTEKNTKVISSPNFSLLGESTPSELFENLEERTVSSGFLPRFLMIEYDGPRVPRSRTFQDIKPPDDLVKKIALLCEYSLQRQRDGVVTVQISPQALNIFDKYDEYCDEQINKTKSDVISELYNRAHLKTLKLAALRAVGINYHSPQISEDDALWAVKFIDKDVKKLMQRFLDEGFGMHNEESKQDRVIIDLCERWIANPWNEKVGNIRMHSFGVIPYAFILNYARANSIFGKDRRGATKAIKETLAEMVKTEKIYELNEMERNKYCEGTRMQCFALSNWKTAPKLE